MLKSIDINVLTGSLPHSGAANNDFGEKPEKKVHFPKEGTVAYIDFPDMQ